MGYCSRTNVKWYLGCYVPIQFVQTILFPVLRPGRQVLTNEDNFFGIPNEKKDRQSEEEYLVGNEVMNLCQVI